MNRTIIAAVALVAGVASAQQATAPAAPTAADPSKVIVATINGETVTRGKIDSLYNAMPAPMRAQYDKAGGKMAFLDNYVGKRLLIQEAMKSGFDKKPGTLATIEAARDSALFDKYVRDVVAAPLVTDADAKKFYDEHKSEFVTPEKVKVRHIVIAWNNKTKDVAFEKIKQVAGEIRAAAVPEAAAGMTKRDFLLGRFIDAAKKYSEDASGPVGGDLGWVAKGNLDPKFEEAAFGMTAGSMSGIVESQFGYHLIWVEGKQAEGVEPFADVKGDIREYLINQKAPDVLGSVTRLTNELRRSSSISVHPENLK